jgi:hypothetical protein
LRRSVSPGFPVSRFPKHGNDHPHFLLIMQSERNSNEIREMNAMTAVRIHTSTPDRWTNPRPHTDAAIRRAKHGPIRPMHEPSWLERLFGLG